ncbi:MAG: lipid-A-disaccharide synthase [candidate division Zixibacteria bacterium]|nr:lipid-A-disaccharide synthase [candidate division Zixibacteria bacterium]
MSNILIVAGEASGDTLGAGFVREFLRLEPDCKFIGLGGDKMASAGVELLYHIRKLAFLGFWEVVKNIRFIKKVEKDILSHIDKIKPQMAVLIDYPGFNLRLASKLKQRGIKVFYYTSPQIWAWGAKRIDKIKSNVDMMAAIFEFENEIYQNAGVPIKWVGHPLLDEIKTSMTVDKFHQKCRLNSNDVSIGLFPGSRLQEINRILPEMLAAIKLISQKYPNIKGIISKAPGISSAVYHNIIDNIAQNALLLENDNYELMAYAKLNMVCSGTATLECAIIGTPMLVLYKTSFLTYHIARRLIKIPYIGMVNVVAKKQIVPELIQGDCAAAKIADVAGQFLDNTDYYNMVKEQLSHIKSKLGETGAARRAAQAAIEVMRG